MPLGERSLKSASPRMHDTPALLHDLADRGVFHPPQPAVRADRILRLQGYPNGHKIRPAVRSAAERCAVDVIGLITPVLHYRRVAIRSIEPDRLVLADGSALMCPAFAKFMEGCHEIVAFVMTLGPDLDKSVIELSERFEMLDAVLLETAGWLCVEACTKSFADALRHWARPRGLTVAMRMGPGYSYKVDGREVAWSLWEQKPLFDLFQGVSLPVELLESCAMLPKMSRSGLFGLAKSPSESKG